MCQLLELFYDQKTSQETLFIHDKAVVSDTVTIADTGFVDAFVVIKDDVIIGKDVRIDANVCIGEGVSIGNNVIIYPNVVIYPGTTIGNNVVINSGAVIGSDGFGYINEKEKWRKIPQVAQVIIEDNVEIGAGVTIDCGCLDPTVIGAGTKIDNLTHIGHNVVIGKHNAIAAQSGFVGSAKTGDHVIVGGQVGVDCVEICENVIVASKAGVTKNIIKPGVYSGFPAQEHQKQLKMEAKIRKVIN